MATPVGKSEEGSDYDYIREVKGGNRLRGNIGSERGGGSD